jgi:hypothetical protein
VRFFIARKGTERSILLEWLLHHQRLITWVFFLLIVALVTLIVAFTLLSGHRTFVDAWYV